MNWKCWFWHDWSPWSDVRVRYWVGAESAGLGSGQVRRCKRCGKKQLWEAS